MFTSSLYLESPRPQVELQISSTTLMTTPPSAVSVFSNLISTSQLTPWQAPPVHPTGPHSLPTEILCMIFHFVFESCVAPSIDSDNHLVPWLDQDPLSPSLFPYALATVCRRWCQILQPIPIYWTRLAITLDAITPSLQAARTTLGWAGTAPLKVVVTRHRGTSETHDSERAAVGRAMILLRPHIDHIWSLSFDVEHTSSIPALWRESGRAQYLKALTLLSRRDAGRVPTRLPAANSHAYEGKLRVPSLQDVTFSDHFLKDSVMAHPRLAGWFRHMTSLTVCGHAPSTMSLYKFLSMVDIFPAIRALTIEDVHFEDHAPCPSLFLLRPAVLCLRRVTGRIALRSILTRTLTRGRSRTHITIVDCAVHGFNESDSDSNLEFVSTNLTLASMDPSATIEDLVCRWNGKRLSVIDCPRMSHAFLERLSGETAPMFLSHLRLVDCDNFNAGDLVALVQSRETQASSASLMGVSDDDSFTALTEVHVQGRGPSINAKRAEWLAVHLERFSWDTVARDGMQYVWDGSRLMVTTCSR